MREPACETCTPLYEGFTFPDLQEAEALIDETG